MKFLLVNPPIYDFAAYDVWMKPLGLLYLAAILKKAGNEVVLFDYMSPDYCKNNFRARKSDGTGSFLSREIPKPDLCEFENIPLKYRRYGAGAQTAEDFFRRHNDADCVVVTLTMVYWYRALEEVVNSLDKTIPRTRRFLGGNYAVLLTEHARAKFGRYFEKIFGKGKNREGFCELMDYLKMDPTEGDVKNFKDWPAPDYSFYDTLPYVVIRKSYGCNFSCDYCASRRMCAGFYSKTSEKIIDELDVLVKTKRINNVAFYDDLLLVQDEKSNIDFLQKLIRWRSSLDWAVKFFTPNGVNPKYITPSVARLLSEAGFRDVRLSMESASDDIQRKYGPKSYFRDFEAAMKNLLSAGYKYGEVSAYVMAGLPGQSMNDVIFSIKEASRCGARVRLCEFSPVPGTKIFYELGLDEKNVEPLLLNNSTFIVTGIKNKISPWCSWEDLNFLKGLVRDMNRNC